VDASAAAEEAAVVLWNSNATSNVTDCTADCDLTVDVTFRHVPHGSVVRVYRLVRDVLSSVRSFFKVF
jgi:hypothetical protein